METEQIVLRRVTTVRPYLRLLSPSESVLGIHAFNAARHTASSPEKKYRRRIRPGRSTVVPGAGCFAGAGEAGTGVFGERESEIGVYGHGARPFSSLQVVWLHCS
jgi:hypothetical protein